MRLTRPTRRAFIAAAPAIIIAPSVAEAWWQSIQQVGVSGGGGSTTTLDPTNTGTNASLNAAHLKMTQNVDGYACSRSLISHSTGKFYWESLCTANGDSGSVAMGVCNTSASMNGQLGSDANGCGLGQFGGFLINTVSSSTGVSAFGAPFLTYGMAVDIGAKLVWFTVNGTQWTDTASGLTGNPATGTNGRDISVITGALFAAVQCRFQNGGGPDLQTETANFGGSSYVYTPPSGFGNW